MKSADQKLFKEKLDYLKKVPLFKDLSSAQLGQLIAIMKAEHFETGSYVIREGEAGSNLFILLEGEVEISKALVLPQWVKSQQKQEKSLLRLSEKHYPFFGEMAMFDDEPERSASIVAIRPCLMAAITKKDLLKVLGNNPEIGMIIYRNIASQLVQRLRKANRDILKLTTAFTLALEG